MPVIMRHWRAPRSGWFSDAIVSGFAASIIMLVAFFTAYGLAFLLSDRLFPQVAAFEVVREWLYNLTSNPLIGLARANLYTTVAIYLGGGIAWSLLYAIVGEAWLSGPGWRRGLVFSIVPGLLSVLVFLPIVGAGPLGLVLNAGPLPVIGNLLLHAIFGMTLGTIYGPFGEVNAETMHGPVVGEDRRVMLQSERLAAYGLVSGLFTGAVIGGIAAIAASLRPDDGLLGQPAAALVLATALLGGALGGLIGSFLGLSSGVVGDG